MGSEDNPPESGPPEDDSAKQRPEGTPSVPSEDEAKTDKPEPSKPEPSEPEKATPDKPTKRRMSGSVKYQDAASTRPKPPTPAELRARQKYEDKQRELEEARLAAEEKRRHQKRVLMGAAAAVGVVGVVAGLGYWLLTPHNTVAQCVRDDPNGQPVIVPDSYCTGHTPGLNGFFFFGGHQYRYYYGSSGSIGSRPIGGTTVAPKSGSITTKSGSTISRGGLGGSGGKGSGGSSGS
ncbi:hypothetical protein GAN17_24770 [Mycobacterium kubicae]|uniref:hypothetical protein n=1 Tax=Mycobacterium kubicae TaxID=120959 RepID=UPI0016416510|nr:hypothetical protein [Mycobacterium kubicae]QNI09094.1 hypothetical protein GAN17_24770 [Mycobacterium kubicae]